MGILIRNSLLSSTGIFNEACKRNKCDTRDVCGNLDKCKWKSWSSFGMFQSKAVGQRISALSQYFYKLGYIDYNVMSTDGYWDWGDCPEECEATEAEPCEQSEHQQWFAFGS